MVATITAMLPCVAGPANPVWQESTDPNRNINDAAISMFLIPRRPSSAMTAILDYTQAAQVQVAAAVSLFLVLKRLCRAVTRTQSLEVLVEVVLVKQHRTSLLL